MNSFSWKCLAVLALAVVLAGCGPNGPKLYKAVGTVTYNNQPVDGAQVNFLYDDGSIANGFTDSAGKFQVSYLGRPDGAALGKGKVGVAKAAAGSTGASLAAAPDKPSTEEEHKAKMKAKEAEMDIMKSTLGNSAPAKDLLPTKYANPATSGLTFEVKANESENDFKFDLKD